MKKKISNIRNLQVPSPPEDQRIYEAQRIAHQAKVDVARIELERVEAAMAVIASFVRKHSYGPHTL